MSPRDMTADLRGYRGAGVGRYTRQEQRRQVIFENDPGAMEGRRREVGGFCCPVPPEPRLSLMQRQRAPHCHWHL